MAQKEIKISQILEAAIKEFLQKGFDAASMHNIAATATVSKRTLYKYYPNKEDLYTELIDQSLNKVKSMYDFTYNSTKSIREQISYVVDKKVELTIDPYFLDLSKMVFGELLKGRTPTEEQLAKIAESEARFLEWIIQAQKDNKLKAELNPELMATQFHSILKGQIFWPVIFGFKKLEDINIDEVKKSTVEFFVGCFSK